MAVGGKFYLTNQTAQAQRFNFGKQMNRKIVEDNLASAQSLGSSFFSINSSATDEHVTLIFEQAVKRIESAIEARNDELLSAVDGINQYA